MAKWKSLNLQNKKDDIEARRDFWSIQVDFVYRHHIEPRVQLYVQKEETFPVPLIFLMSQGQPLHIWT